MEKKRLRRLMSQELRAYTSAEQTLLSEDTCSLILSNPRVIAADTVVAFWPLPDEVDIRPAIRELYQQGKTVLLPRVVSDTEMVLCLYEGDSSLVEGAYGIMEPAIGSEQFSMNNEQLAISNEQFSMNNEQLAINNYDYLCSLAAVAVLVPGRAFDHDGHRLGRGKGYYDRFLASCPEAHTIAVCYPFQIIDNVPTNQYDIPVKELIWKISK